MSDRAKQIAIGVVVLVALGLLGTLVVLFGSLPDYFRRSNYYTVRFTEAPGVSAGTPVRRSGVRIGEVADVILDDERGIVRVRVGIDPRYTLHQNEQATLVTGLFGGDVSIDFIPAQAEGGQPVDRAALEPGAEVVGVRQANVNTLLNRASEVVPTTQETLNDMRKSMQRLERMAPLAEETMREYRDLARQTREALPEVRRTNEEVRRLAEDVRATMPELRRTNESLRKLADSANAAVPDLRKNADDVAATARVWGRVGERVDLLLQTNQERITKIVENLNESLIRVNDVLSEANRQNLSSVIEKTRIASERFPSISRNVDDISNEGRTSVRRLNDTLVRLDATLADLQKTTRPLGERGPAITQNLDESLAKLNATLGDARALMRVLDQGDGTLRRILVDPSLYQHLDEAACVLAKAMPRVELILRNIEIFADKLARHPESIGLRGAIKPSNGLKDPPTPPIAPYQAGFPAGVPPGH
jgi:ABC-type transporter Mla subunit MlaD